MKAKYNPCCPQLPGIPTYILLNTTGLSPPARADRLELLSLTGEALKTLPIRYYPERQPYGLWNITEFIPPKEAFFLRVTGYDQHGFPFQRVSSVSFSSVVPGQCRNLRSKRSCQCEQFYVFVRYSPSRRPQGADASNNKRLLPTEWGRQMPNREPDPLHAAVQQRWEAAWGRPVLQVRRTIF